MADEKVKKTEDIAVEEKKPTARKSTTTKKEVVKKIYTINELCDIYFPSRSDRFVLNKMYKKEQAKTLDQWRVFLYGKYNF